MLHKHACQTACMNHHKKPHVFAMPGEYKLAPTSDCMQCIRRAKLQGVVTHAAVPEWGAVGQAWSAVEGKEACRDLEGLQSSEATIHKCLWVQSNSSDMSATVLRKEKLF